MPNHSKFSLEPLSVTLGAVLARGSPGITLYHADLQLGSHTTKVAVKVLQTSDAPAAAAANFAKEVCTIQLASAACQRVCRMLGCGKLNGDTCIVMSLYPKSAVKLLSEGPLALPELVALGLEILEGLMQLHAVQILHLDLKPANILLDDYSHAYLSDFGISQVLSTLEACTAVTGMSGTPHYMAPEQADAEFGSKGPHSDVWGFAACMLHLTTGQAPYHDLSQHQMLTAMIKKRQPEIPTSMPAWMQQALQQCFSFDTAARPSVPYLHQTFKEHAICGQLDEKSGTEEDTGASVSATEEAASDVEDKASDSNASSGDKQSQYLQSALDSLVSQDPDEQEGCGCGCILYAIKDSVPKHAIVEAGILPPLTALLKSPQDKVRKAAADAIGQLAHGDSEMGNAVVETGALPYLEEMLRSPQTDVQEAAAAALRKLLLAADSASQGVLLCLAQMLQSEQIIVKEAAASVIGVLPTELGFKALIAIGAWSHLVDMLPCPHHRLQKTALEAIEDMVLAEDVVAAGIVAPLMTLLKSEENSLVLQAADFIGQFRRGKGRAFVQAGVISLLLELVRSPFYSVTTGALYAIKGLAEDDSTGYAAEAVIAAGALPLMITLMNGEHHLVAANAIAQMASASNQGVKNAIIDCMNDADALPDLMTMLGHPNHITTQSEAAFLVQRLSVGSQPFIDALVAAGALPLLLAMLEDPDPAWYVRGCVRAAGAIRHIAQGTHENRESVIAAGVLPVLVQSLDRDREIAAEAAWALCNMASGDQKCKDAVLQAGAGLAVVKLPLSCHLDYMGNMPGDLHTAATELIKSLGIRHTIADHREADNIGAKQ